MKIQQHNNGAYTAVSDDGKAIGEGATFLEAMLDCGEVAELADKAKAGAL